VLDHIGLTVADLARSQGFFDAALAPLGVGPIVAATAEETGSRAFLG
jgi:catechol 2,3-dioxygenase-like lactoylglutathione lyase family enzyme